MYVSVLSKTTFIIYNVIKRQLKDHINDMFQLIYKATFRLQLKRCFDIQLAMFLQYKISLTLEYEI